MSVKNGINGWAGSIVRINLTTGSITTEDTLPKYKPYIGGMGLGYKVIWDEVPLDSDWPAGEGRVRRRPADRLRRAVLRPYEHLLSLLLEQGQFHRGRAHGRPYRACLQVRWL